MHKKGTFMHYLLLWKRLVNYSKTAENNPAAHIFYVLLLFYS